MNQGLEALMEWRLESAQLNFEAVQRIDPGFWPATYYLAVSLKKQGRLREAKSVFVNLHQIHPNGEASIELGEIYLAEGQFASARKCFEFAVTSPTTATKGKVSIGILQALQGKPKQAIESFEEVIKAEPKSPEGYLWLALVKVTESRMTSKSVELFDQVLKVDSTNRTALFWRALVHMYIGESELALTDLNKLIPRSPGNPLFLGLRGTLLESLERYDQAYPDLMMASKLPHIYSGRFYLDQLNEAYDLSQASNYVQRNIYGLKDPAFGFVKKGFCQLAVGKYDEALTSLNLAIEQGANLGANGSPLASIYLLKAVLLEKQSQPDSAHANFNKALKLDNDIYFAHLKQVVHFLRKGDTANAFYATKEMKRIEPDNELTYRISGWVKSTLGDFAGCASDLTRHLNFDSTNLELLKLRAQCRARNLEYKGALKDILRYRAEVPDDESTTELLIESALGAGDTALVVRVLQPLCDEEPNNCELQLALSDYLISTKSLDRARSITNKVLGKLENGTCNNAAIFVFILKARALYILGKIHLRNAELEPALKRFSEAFLYQQDANILLARCTVLIKLGRMEQAKKDLVILQNAKYGPAQPYIQKYLNP